MHRLRRLRGPRGRCRAWPRRWSAAQAQAWAPGPARFGWGPGAPQGSLVAAPRPRDRPCRRTPPSPPRFPARPAARGARAARPPSLQAGRSGHRGGGPARRPAASHSGGEPSWRGRCAPRQRPPIAQSRRTGQTLATCLAATRASSQTLGEWVEMMRSGWLFLNTIAEHQPHSATQSNSIAPPRAHQSPSSSCTPCREAGAGAQAP